MLGASARLRLRMSISGRLPPSAEAPSRPHGMLAFFTTALTAGTDLMIGKHSENPECSIIITHNPQIVPCGCGRRSICSWEESVLVGLWRQNRAAQRQTVALPEDSSGTPGAGFLECEPGEEEFGDSADPLALPHLQTQDL